jgi:hypothetical protein
MHPAKEGRRDSGSPASGEGRPDDSRSMFLAVATRGGAEVCDFERIRQQHWFPWWPAVLLSLLPHVIQMRRKAGHGGAAA